MFDRRAFGRWGLTVFANLAEMRTHGIPGFFRIVAFYCIENSFVMNLPALGTSGNFKNSQALFAEKSNDGIDQGKNDGVGGGFGQRQMKVEISLDVSVRIAAGAVHDGDGLAHGGQFRLLDSNCGQGGDLGLENGSHFGKLMRALGLTDFGDEIE